MTEYNIYCDESCHLQFDGNNIIVLGGIKCKKEEVKRISNEILELKIKHGIKIQDEIKWTKISPANKELFIDMIDYFFDSEDLSFRGYIGCGKKELKFKDKYEYNEWYYKMYYRMLEYILDSDIGSTYNLFIDIKDTIGSEKIKMLQRYLNNHHYRDIINNSLLVRSEHFALLQLADLLIGAISYKHRNLNTSSAKLEIIDHFEKRAHHTLIHSVPYSNTKANWFVWVPESWR